MHMQSSVHEWHLHAQGQAICAAYWGGGENVLASPARETLAALDATDLGYRWRGIAVRLTLRSRRSRAGRGLTPGFSRAGAWGPG